MKAFFQNRMIRMLPFLLAAVFFTFPVRAEEILSDGDENAAAEITAEADVVLSDLTEESGIFVEELPEAGAASNSCGKNLKWSFKNGVLTVSGTGAMYDYYWDNLPPWNKDGSILPKLKTVVLEEGVTSIGNYAFVDCTKLEKVTLPSTLAQIGASSFEYCSDLDAVTFPAGLKKISGSAFRFCDDLTEIRLPDGIEDFGSWTFEDCTGLKTVVIPYGVKAIGDGCFRGCTKLSSVTMYDSISSIGGYAFRGCESLKTITLPRSVKTIGQYAFHTAGLSSITIPTGVAMIDYGTFFECYSLTHIELPYTLKTVRRGAFYDCTALRTIAFTGSAADWRSISVDRDNNNWFSAARVSYIEPPVEEIVPSVVYRLTDEGSGFLRIYWRAVRGADGYQVRWSKDEKMKKGVRSASYSGCSNAIRGDLEVGSTYYAQVRVYKMEQGQRVYTFWSGKKSITLTKELETPVLQELTVRNSKIRAAGKTVGTAEGYQVRFADNPQFKHAVTASAKGKNASSYSRSGLARGKTWYVTVRTYCTGADGNRYYSRWSETMQISY